MSFSGFNGFTGFSGFSGFREVFTTRRVLLGEMIDQEAKFALKPVLYPYSSLTRGISVCPNTRKLGYSTLKVQHPNSSLATHPISRFAVSTVETHPFVHPATLLIGPRCPTDHVEFLYSAVESVENVKNVKSEHSNFSENLQNVIYLNNV